MSVGLSYTFFIYKALYLNLIVSVSTLLSFKALVLWTVYVLVISLKLYVSCLILRWLLCYKQITDYLYSLVINYLTSASDFNYQATELQWYSSQSHNLQKLSPFSDWGRVTTNNSISRSTYGVGIVLGLINCVKAFITVRFKAPSYGLGELDNAVATSQQFSSLGNYSDDPYNTRLSRTLLPVSLMEVTVLPDFYWVVYNRRLNN